MRKIRLLLFSLFTLSIFLVNSVKANEHKFENLYLKVGYKEVDQALDECNKHFKREITLPKKVPPITFTHSFGRLINADGVENDYFDVEYLNEKSGDDHYKIAVRPIEYKMTVREEMIDDVLKLNDGNKAIYSTTMATGFNSLMFDKNGWQYVLYLDQDTSDKSLELLLEVANSID